MALILRDGDYVSDGQGGFEIAEGNREILERILWKLTVRRGSFPFLPELGSRLHLLGRAAARERESLAMEYVTEALGDEEVTVTEVTLTQEGDQGNLTVHMDWRGEKLMVTVAVGGLT